MQLQEQIKQVIARLGGSIPIPELSQHSIVGFPSPAEAYAEATLKPNDYLISNATATFMIRHSGDEMEDAKILDGDIVVYDRSVFHQEGDIVVANVDGEFKIRTLGNNCLLPAKAGGLAIRFTEGMEVSIIGVVRGVMRRF